MDKTATIIWAVLLFYLALGFLLAVFPDQSNVARNTIFRSVGMMSQQQAHRVLSPPERLKSRIFGIIFVIGSLFVLTQITWQWGKWPETSSPASAISAYKTEKHANDADLHQMVSRLVTPITRQHVGLVVATIADDAYDITGFGRIDLDSDSVPDGETIFEIGSLSKVFTGISLAESIHRADLSLQTDVSSLLPELIDLPLSRIAPVTLEQLVTHTSGLPRMPAQAFGPSVIWKTIIAGDSYQHYRENDLLTLMTKKNSSVIQEEEFHYSNAGFGLLGHILSQRYGMNYDALIQSMIARPLDMKDTGIALDSERRMRFASGYRNYVRLGRYYLAQRAVYWNFPNCLAGAGGLRSTANDMLAFLEANMGRKKSEITPALNLSHRILFSRNADRIGMAWFHKTLPLSAESIIFHNGGTGGFSSFLGFSANGRFGICILSNSTKSVDYIGEKILESLALTD